MDAAKPGWRKHMGWLVVLAVALAGVAAWRVWRPVAADAVTVRSQPFLRSLQFSGRVKTPQRVEVGTTVTGRVEQVLVHEGDRVVAGAPLLRLESAEWRAALAQAQSNLQQAQARLQGQQALALPNAQAALAQAEANARAAERDLARVKDLVAAQFYSPARLDEARRSVDVARAQRDAARAQVQAQGQRGADTAATQAQWQAARAAVQVAQARLDQATVRAPGAGRVLLRQVEPGQIVQAGRALLTLSVAGPAELVAQADERFVGQLQPGQKARVRADAYPDQPFDAVLDRLAPAVDAQRGSVEATFVVAPPVPAFLREDMTLSIEVVTGQRPAALVLPLRALRAGADDPSSQAQLPQAPGGQPKDGAGSRGQVLRVQQGRAVLSAVTLGMRTLDQVEVLSGLADGDVVVLDPAVAPGSRVRPRQAAQAAAASGREGELGSAMSNTFGR